MKVVDTEVADKDLLTSFVEGTVRSRTLIDSDGSSELRVMVAQFAAGSHNLPHTHSFDQALLITAGEGIVATDDESRVVRVGEVVLIPSGERHWHGATAGQSMTHLAVGIPGKSDFDGVAYTATE